MGTSVMVEYDGWVRLTSVDRWGNSFWLYVPADALLRDSVTGRATPFRADVHSDPFRLHIPSGTLLPHGLDLRTDEPTDGFAAATYRERHGF